jgi:hypothetical protein
MLRFALFSSMMLCLLFQQVINPGGGTSGSGVTSVATTGPIAGGPITATGTISLQNSAAANVTAAYGTDTAYFTGSGGASTNGDIISGDANGGTKDSGTALSTFGIFMGGCTSNTPASTQYCPPVGKTAVASAENGQAFVLPRAITASAIYVNLINAEGAAATLQFTLAYCTTTACSAVTTTGLTCTVANSASTCNQTGQAVSLTAGQNIVIQTVQSGTGTASVSSVSIAYQ